MTAAGKAFNVDTSPTKEVVVSGLTKDASVEACILDLIDNAVDAVHENAKRAAPGGVQDNYHGWTIELALTGTGLKIKDNAGGISIQQLKSEVLRFGKRTDHDHGIGAFGVGLNRAIFKLGRTTLIVTDTGKERSSLTLKTEDYLKDADEWEIIARQYPTSGKDGTVIEISRPPEDIAHQFTNRDWVDERREEIGHIYGRFISKGLAIEVNSIPAKNLEVPLRENGPYEIEEAFYKTDDGAVRIFIRCGQHRDHRFGKEKDYNAERNRPLTDQFGWNILCNDRAILSCDTTDKTGWDDYHSEYYGFVGYVNFVSADPSKLPWNTTKSDIDLNNAAYRMALGGMRAFVKKWKSIADKRKREAPPRPIPPKKGKDEAPATRRKRKDKKVKKPAPVEKLDHHQFRTILPADVDERYCVDKHLKVVHEAKALDLGDSAYTGMALMRMLFEFSVAAYLVRHSKFEELRKFAIERRRSKGMKILPEDEKKVNPAIEEIIPYLDNNPAVWGAKENYLKHSLKKMGAHVATLNTAIHNPFQPVDRSRAFEIRDEILPMVRHLIETKQNGK